mmetsp:Transcript_16341/g.46425  ORF Transcript_16341/g.46425 Transcript_16341/m.46425 type:complete len:236 (+) Transcript_16341:3196-3903(+)
MTPSTTWAISSSAHCASASMGDSMYGSPKASSISFTSSSIIGVTTSESRCARLRSRTKAACCRTISSCIACTRSLRSASSASRSAGVLVTACSPSEADLCSRPAAASRAAAAASASRIASASLSLSLWLSPPSARSFPVLLLSMLLCVASLSRKPNSGTSAMGIALLTAASCARLPRSCVALDESVAGEPGDSWPLASEGVSFSLAPAAGTRARSDVGTADCPCASLTGGGEDEF